MLKYNSKKLERREKFRKIGAAITKLGDPNVNDYHTGAESSFQIKRGPSHTEDGVKPIVGGPQFKTPQWERTIRSES